MPKRVQAPAEVSTLPCYACAFRVRRSILGRLLRSSLLLTAITIAILGTLSFVVARSLLTQRVLGQLAADASVREDLLEETLREGRVRTAILAQDAAIVHALEGRSSPSLVALQRELERRQIPAVGIAVFDRDAVLRAGSGDADAMRVERRGVIPIVRSGEWTATDIAAPIHRDGVFAGTLIIRYGVLRTRQLLFQELGLGAGEGVVLGEERQGVLYPFVDANGDHRTLPLELFGMQHETALSWRDANGDRILGAYRSLPSVGWGLLVRVPSREALSTANKLAFTFLALGVFLLELTGVLALALARSFTSPVLALTTKVKQLQTGSWNYRPTVATGDELEFLDRVLGDLTGKLKRTYESLEETIVERTSQLKSQYALDRAMLRSIRQGIIAVDADGRITQANPAACAMLLTESTDVVGAPAVGTIVISQRRKGAFPPREHPVALCLRSGRAFVSTATMHLTLQRRDSTFLPITVNVTPFPIRRGASGAVVVLQDVTAERQVDYLKSEFISLASHQLRTPLTTIRWYVELLRDAAQGQLSEKQRAYAREIDSAALRMANLLEALLRVARLEGGALKVEKQRIDVSTFLREVSEEWRENTQSTSVTLKVSVPRRPLYFETDPTLLRIVLQNLFSNALKYSEKGSTVELTMSFTKRSVVISVKDRGLGIPAAEQPRVFQKFFRAKNVRRMQTDGSGLGLYISKTILEGLGGTIRFRSHEKEGTTFTVTLPRK